MFDRLLNKPLQLRWLAGLKFWNSDILLFLIAKYYLLKVLLRKCRIKIMTNNYSYRKYFFHPFHHENIPEKCLVICYFNSTLKDINQNFTGNRSNEKNSRTHLPEKANFWTFDPFNDFFGNLKLVKVRNAHPKVTVLCGQFYHEAHIICSWNLLVCS